MFTAALFTAARIGKQPRCPSMNEWIKVWCICTMEYHSAIKKKKEILPFVTTQDIKLSEINQGEKDIRCMTSLIYGI